MPAAGLDPERSKGQTYAADFKVLQRHVMFDVTLYCNQTDGFEGSGLFGVVV